MQSVNPLRPLLSCSTSAALNVSTMFFSLFACGGGDTPYSAISRIRQCHLLLRFTLLQQCGRARL
eukprot:6185009-Pleurochrysis_carterae.AAC.6